MVSTERIREATVITTEALLRGDCCLQLATAEAIDRRVITGHYANAGVVDGFGIIPSDYSSITLLSVMVYCLLLALPLIPIAIVSYGLCGHSTI